MKRLILGGFVVAALALAGCEGEVHTTPLTVGAEYDIAPVQVEYDGGAYVGTNWVWHDKAGREYREERAVHERRMASRHGEKHEEHHEEHH